MKGCDVQFEQKYNRFIDKWLVKLEWKVKLKNRFVFIGDSCITRILSPYHEGFESQL